MRAIYSKTSDILRLEEMPVVDFSLDNLTKIVKIKFRVFYDSIKINDAKLGKVYLQLKSGPNNSPSLGNFSLEKSILFDNIAIEKNSSSSISFRKIQSEGSIEKNAFTYEEIKDKENPPEILSIKKHETTDFYNQVFYDKEDPGFGKLLAPAEYLTGNSTQETITQTILSSFNFIDFSFDMFLNNFLDINALEVSYISPDLKLIDFVEMKFDASSFYEIYKLGLSANDSRGLTTLTKNYARTFSDYLEFEDSLWENKVVQVDDPTFFIKRSLVKDANSKLQAYNFVQGDISTSIENTNIPFYYDENNFYVKRVPLNVSLLRAVAVNLLTGITKYSNYQNSNGVKSIVIPNFLESSSNYEIKIEYDGKQTSNNLIFNRINKKFDSQIFLQSFDDNSTITAKKSGSNLSVLCVESISMYDGSQYFSECKLLNADIKFENLKYDSNFGTAYVIHQIHIPKESVFSSSKDIFSYSSYPHSIKTVYSNPQSSENIARISAINIIKTPWKTNIIKWQVDGDSNKIDHFRIYARSELLGIERLLGCTPNVNRFEDKNTDIPKSLGKVTYTVRPVFTNFNVGDEKSLTFEKRSSLPSVFLNSFNQQSEVNFEFYGDSFQDIDLQLETQEGIRNKLHFKVEKINVTRGRINVRNDYAKDIISRRIIVKKAEQNYVINETDYDKLTNDVSRITSNSAITNLVQSSQYVTKVTSKKF